VSAEDGRPTISRFIGVYDADHTLRGELAYFVKARLGVAHCALCSITHGLVREKASWRECRTGLGVPFDTYHRDDRPAEVAAATGGEAPVVLAEVVGDRGVELVVLLGPQELDRCAGSIEAMSEALRAAAARVVDGWAQVHPDGPT
jgi:hypothetical protein